MRTSTLSAAALLAGSAAAAVDCVEGLHIIVGRGSDEPQGLGATGALAQNISNAIPDSDISAIVYPATITSPIYNVSETEGAQNVYDQVTQYHKACPGHKMAYLGWSQGAQIAVNAFCGGQGGIFGNAAAIPADAVKDVVAIAIFGDPSHNTSAPFDKGTSTADGLFSRNGIGACADFASKIVSYCDTGDIYCDGGNNRSVHGLYLVRYAEEMQKFVVDNYNKATVSSNSSSTTGGNSTVTTAAPSASGSQTSKPSSSSSSSSSASPTTSAKSNAAASVSSGMMIALPAAMLAAAQLLL